MSSIPAIQTHYKGYYFRSRLEARWAVFFDALHIKWEYEKEGYEFEEAGETLRYLPDFWLPDEEWWIEIKGQTPTIHECHLAERLAQLGSPVVILWGNIMEQKGHCWWPDGRDAWANWFVCWDTSEWGLVDVADISARCQVEARDYDNRVGMIHNAYVAARSARFEYQRQEPGIRFRHEEG